MCAARRFGLEVVEVKIGLVGSGCVRWVSEGTRPRFSPSWCRVPLQKRGQRGSGWCGRDSAGLCGSGCGPALLSGSSSLFRD